MLPTTKVVGLILLLSLQLGDPVSALLVSDCTTAECYGAKAVEDFDTIFGTEEDFLAGFEAQLKPMLTQYLGFAIAVAGFVLVLRSLTR